MTASQLADPQYRDTTYGENVAKYLVDLHDSKSTFDFCGGMMFQLVLSDKLRSHLADVAANGGEQPVLFPATANRMMKMPGQVKDAAGGMGFVLHLSHAGEDDPEGWTPEERARYDGWGHDSGREWRKGEQLEREGFDTFKSKFGE